MAAVSTSAFARGAVLSIAFILILFPLTMLLLSGNSAYYLNVIFYSQRIFLIASVFLLLFYVVFRKKIVALGWKPPDVDDAVVYAAMAFSLVFLLGFLHANFDTILRMEVMDVGSDSMSLGFGGFLADSFDLARIYVDSGGIKKMVDADNESYGATLLRIHGGWEGEGALDSRVLLSVNGGPEIDLSQSFAALNRSQPSWIDVPLSPEAFKAGSNVVQLGAEGSSKVFISSQWVYHDGKTLGSDDKYYGQEALIYLKAPPNVPPLFTEAFRFQLIIKLVAFVFLFLALFGIDAMSLAWTRFNKHLLAIAGVSILAIIVLIAIQNLWTHLSALTAAILPVPLGLISGVYTDLSDPAGAVIGMNNFYVRIAESCSGIESIGVFIFLFPIIVALNWGSTKMWLIPFLFVAGIAGAFLVNVMRLAFLILIGAFISPDLALNVFHTNLGWVLMLGYFAIFNEAMIKICRRRSDEDQ